MPQLKKRTENLLVRAREIADASVSQSTRTQYAMDWRLFFRWAAPNAQPTGDALADLLPLLPVDVDMCLAWIAQLHDGGLATSTIKRRMAALRFAHVELGLPSPTGDPRVKKVLAGIARLQADQPSKAKRALTLSMVAASLPSLSVRDRAITLVAIATGLRRAPLAALEWTDLREVHAGLLVQVRRDKSDQTGRGVTLTLPRSLQSTCPVRALGELRRHQAEEMPPSDDPRVFRCAGRTINRVFKRVAEMTGADPKAYGAHSSRAGLATAAADADVDLIWINKQLGHRSMTTTARYVREHDAKANPAPRAVLEQLDRIMEGE